MNKTILNLLIATPILLSLAACQAAPRAAPAPGSGASPTAAPAAPSSLPATRVPTLVPSPAPSPTPVTQPAVAVVQSYFAALQAGDDQKAASYYSAFSLTADGLTRAEAADALHQQRLGGTRWSDLQVTGAQLLDPKTVLVGLSYQLTSPDPKTGKAVSTHQQEQWPLRQENGRWGYNRTNLIDFHTLDVPAKLYAGLTVQPRQLRRYADHLTLELLVQNATNEPIVWGGPSEILAAFQFGGQVVEASTPRLIFDRLRSYPETVIAVAGFFPRYPEGVELRRWKNYPNTLPWFTFRFSE